MDSYVAFRSKEESKTKTTRYEGIEKPSRIEMSSGQLAIHGANNNKVQTILQIWMFKDQRFAYLIPGQYDIERISSTKTNTQCHEKSYFEDTVNSSELNKNIQDKLKIGSEVAAF